MAWPHQTELIFTFMDKMPTRVKYDIMPEDIMSIGTKCPKEDRLG